MSNTSVKVLTLAQIDALINKIKKNGQKLRDDAHFGLVSIIDHYIDNGDYTRLPTLVEVTKNYIGSSIAQAMVQWVHDNVTSLQFDKDQKKFVHTPKMEKAIRDIELKDDDGNVTFKGNARDFPFYKYEIKRDPTPFDFAEALGKLIERAKKANEKNVKEGAHNKVNGAQIAMLEKAINLETFAALEPANNNPNDHVNSKMVKTETAGDTIVSAEVEPRKAKKAKAA